MGVVWAARDHLLERDVALKLLRPDRRPDEGRLREEFALLAALDHPGVVTVRDVGVADGSLYLSTDLLSGLTLDRWLAREPDADSVDAVVADLLATLGWLHQQEVVHADIKPANILIQESAHGIWPTLIDFGLARDRDESRLLGGTPKYMAPELMAGSPPSPRTDLYALGVAFALTPHPSDALQQLLDALCAKDVEQRPATAFAALALLSGDHPGNRHHLGSHGAARLWDGVAQTLADAAAGGDGVHRVSLTAEGDAVDLLNAVKARLELAGHHVLLPPVSLVRSGPRALFQRLADCLAPGELNAPPQASLRVEDHKEILDVFAGELVERLRRATPWVLLLPYPDVLGPAGRYLLARLIEAGCIRRAILAGGHNELQLGRGVDADITSHPVPPPGPAALGRYLSSHGIGGDVPPPLDTAIADRGKDGARAVRELLDRWIDAGALAHSPDGWQWVPSRATEALDAPDMDDAWANRWERLGSDARRTLTWIAALGGQASRAQLLYMGLDRRTWEPLQHEGWLRGQDGGLALSDGNRRRIAAGALTGSAPSTAMRKSAVAALEDDRTPNARNALASHYSALGRPNEAIDVWTELARHWERALDPVSAARSALAAAEEAAETLAPGGLEAAGYALRLSLAAADKQGCDAALQCAQTIAEAEDRADTHLRLAVLAARAHAYQARTEDALNAVERARAGLETPGTMSSLPIRERHWLGLDVALAEGTALNQRGDAERAAAALQKAARLAEEDLADPHAVGRVSNNLGIAYFNLGRFEDAADAWARTAEAKEACGDLRGKRIASSNRGLALRELGQVPAAARAAREALRLARRTGDRHGMVMGQLSLAQLWLDLGATSRAEAALEALEGIAIASRLLQADIEVVRLRADIAAGRWDTARKRAQGALSEAVGQQLTTIVRELWPLTWLIRLNHPGGVAVGADGDAAPDGVDGGHSPAWSAASACYDAQAGRWDQARTSLASLLASPQAPDTVTLPGAMSGLALATWAAHLLGDEALVEAFGARARRTVARRYQERVALLGDDPTVTGVLECARALSLTLAFEAGSPQETQKVARDLLETSGVNAAILPLNPSSDVDSDRLGREPTRAVGLDVSALSAVQGASATARGWATVLQQAAQAHGCALVDVAAGDVRVVAEAGARIRLARFDAIIRQVAAADSPAPWFAQTDGRVEAAVLPLLPSDASEAVGLGVLVFDTGLHPRRLLESLLALPNELAALALDRRRLRERLEALEQAHAELAAAHAELRERHVDELTSLRQELEQSRSQLMLRFSYDNIVHHSDGMRRVLRMVDRLSDRDINVLVVGESGVGKEVIARALHANSPRARGPFIAENCGAVPPDLFESVFFGHVRGAFTGAHRAAEGLFEAAKGGTLFLDELGELPLNQQVKLLRVLQERRFRPVGATREREADFRLVAATNRDLGELIEAGAFREDLFYRVAVVSIPIPPLRERRADILPLAKKFLDGHAQRRGATQQLSVEAGNALARYDWPGNVRELENEMLRASVLCDGDSVRQAHLSPKVLKAESGRNGSGASRPTGGPNIGWDGEESLADVVARVEAEVIRQALQAERGKKISTARALGLSRPGLDAKLERYGIDAAAIKKRAKRKQQEPSR